METVLMTLPAHFDGDRIRLDVEVVFNDNYNYPLMTIRNAH